MEQKPFTATDVIEGNRHADADSFARLSPQRGEIYRKALERMAALLRAKKVI